MSSNSPVPTRGTLYRLPRELKLAIVHIAIAGEGGRCEDRETARSLTVVDKELSEMARSILFKALDFRPLAALRAFADHAPTTIKELVRSADLRDNDVVFGLESSTAAGRLRREVCAEILRALPAVTEVTFPFPQVWTQENLELLYVFDSRVGARMRRLSIIGGTLILPLLLTNTPNLRHLTLDDQLSFHEEISTTLGSLNKLTSFGVHFMASGSGSLGAPIAWSSHLRSMALDLAARFSEDVPYGEILSHFLVGASTTLTMLKLGLAALEAIDLQPLQLTSLTILELNTPNPFNHLFLCARSPLRELTMGSAGPEWPLHPEYIGPPIAETLLQPFRATLKYMSCEWEEVEIWDEDIEGIEQWCEKAGVELIWGEGEDSS